MYQRRGRVGLDARPSIDIQTQTMVPWKRAKQRTLDHYWRVEGVCLMCPESGTMLGNHMLQLANAIEGARLGIA